MSNDMKAMGIRMRMTFMDNVKLIAIIAAVIFAAFHIVGYFLEAVDKKSKNLRNQMDLGINYRLKIKTVRNSTEHYDLQSQTLSGNLKAAHLLAWNHASGFDDGEANYTEAANLLKLAMPERLPDTFFLLAIVGPAVNLSDEKRYALIQMGKGFENKTFSDYEKVATEKFMDLEPKLTTTQKMSAKNLLKSCEEKNYTDCIN